jgi:hypothetical protein
MAMFAAIMLLCVAAQILFRFVALGFDFSYLASPQFWGSLIIQNFLLLVFSVVAWISARYDEEYKSEEISRLKENIDDGYLYICNNNLTVAFDEQIEHDNATEKLLVYKEQLNHKIGKARSKKRKERLKLKLATAEADIDTVKVKYERLSSSIIFSHTANGGQERSKHSAQDSLEVFKLIISKISMLLIFTVLLRSFIPTSQEFTLVMLYESVIDLFSVVASYFFATMSARMHVTGKVTDVFKENLKYIKRFFTLRNAQK